MSDQPKEKSLAGPLLLLFVLLFDVGLAVWGWHLYQMKQGQYSAAGLNVASAPKAPLIPRSFAPSEPAPMADPAANIIKTPDLRYPDRTPPPARPSEASPSAAPASAPAGSNNDAPFKQSRIETRLLVVKAQGVYFALKKDPRFKNSPVIQAWKSEFLSYPDLREINQRFQRDRDGVTFLVHMARSPNLSVLLGKYLKTPDIQSFIKSMRDSPVVMDAAHSFLADFNLRGALKRLPGLGEDSAPNPSAISAAPGGASAVQRLSGDPKFKKYLDQTP